MKGSVYWNKAGKKWVVSIRWEGKRYYIYKDKKAGTYFYNKVHAYQVLGAIQEEIKDDSFKPRTWLPESPLGLYGYSRVWLSDKDASKKTLRDYRGYIDNHIIPFLGKEKDIRRIRGRDIKQLKKHLTTKLSSKGVYNVLSCLRTMLRDAYRDEEIDRLILFPQMGFTLPEIEYLTMEQQNQVLEHIPPVDRPIFIVGMELGLRVQEVRALQWNCIHGNEINIKRSFRENELVETTKTGKARILPLSSFLWRVFSEIDRKLSPFIFTREDNKPYTNKNLNRIWRTACEKAGVKIKLQNALRHSLGCQLLDQGEELELVRDIYGHSKTDMTRRYAKRSTAPMADALDRRRKVIQFKKAKD